MRATKSLFFLTLAIFSLTFYSFSAAAQGVIIPRPCDRCPGPRPPQLPNALPIKSIKIDTKIVNQVATTHVEQIFHNDTGATLEGTFFFPIPETASVSEFAIWDGNRRLVGEVRSREEARRIYDDIVRKMRDPGLLEYAGKDLFQASIFPIPALSDKKLEITFTQVLKAESGVVGYRYPLGTGRNLNHIGTVSGSIDIAGKGELRNIYSPTHNVDVTKRKGDHATVSFETKGDTRPQDFQLFYSISADDFGMSLLTYREPGKDGYFLLMVSPRDEMAQREYTAKDVVFVIDTSGSMADEGKIAKARSALQFGIQSLHNEDRFNVISFAGEEHLMAAGLVNADDRGRQQGTDFAKRLTPNGGTNINDSLLAAERLFDNAQRPRMIVFLTDGLPTVGTTDINRITANVHGNRPDGVRIFTFGVGYDVNTALLDKIAGDNGGVAEYVEPKEDLEQKVSAFFSKISYPVLSNIKLDLGGVETDLMYPREMQDLFKGGQLTIIGRYRNPVDLEAVRIKLSGRSGSNERTAFFDGGRFPVVSSGNDFLPRLWANRRVGWLLEQIRINGEQKELKDEVVDLGTRFGIVTPYTSYLATEGEDRAQPIDAPANVTSSNRKKVFGGIRRGSAGGASSAPAPTSGAQAVAESKASREMSDEVVVVDKDTRANIKRAGGKTFYLTDGVWTDSEVQAQNQLPETTVVFASEDYFNLIKKFPRLADYFAVGEQVAVFFEGRIYRVKSSK
jgi:uncharacterized protein YegL